LLQSISPIRTATVITARRTDSAAAHTTSVGGSSFVAVPAVFRADKDDSSINVVQIVQKISDLE
jgi:hypothetical protein